MTLGEKISALTQPLRGGRREADEQERLLKLYWNRAELKKELASLDDDLYQLGDRLKQQTAATQRARDELESLETLLGNPEFGYAALAHYQLRGLWRACHLQLGQFIAELRRQQEDRERKRELVQFHEDRQARLLVAVERLSDATASAQSEAASEQALRAALAAATGLWRYFRRRTLQDQLTQQVSRSGEAQRVLEDIGHAKRTIEKEPWPEFTGLSLDGQRAINNAAIGYGQLLYVQLASVGLATRSRAARHATLQESQYGSPAECEALMAEIAVALAAVKANRDIGDELRARAELIRASASYRHPVDAVPQDRSLPSAYAYTGTAVPVREANVLADDYWDLRQLLLG